ncbi:MAG: single-stranded DNA-binding protein [Actinomycetes bacterium]
MNAVQLIGRLTHDPEADETADGRSVATIRRAIDRVGRDGADFVTVKVWDRLAEAVVQHLARGRQVAVQGRLHHDEWTGPGGDYRSRLLVVARRVEFLGSSTLSPRLQDQHEGEGTTPARASGL